MNFLLIMCILQFSSTKILAEKILFNGKSYKSTEIRQIRFPYKPVYGLPEHFNCTMITKEEFEQCEIQALKAWTITIRNYVSYKKIIHFTKKKYKNILSFSFINQSIFVALYGVLWIVKSN